MTCRQEGGRAGFAVRRGDHHTPRNPGSFKWIDGQFHGISDRTLFRLERAGS